MALLQLQPGAVKLMLVRRATAPGRNDPSENKAAEFMQDMAHWIYVSGFEVSSQCPGLLRPCLDGMESGLVDRRSV